MKQNPIMQVTKRAIRRSNMRGVKALVDAGAGSSRWTRRWRAFMSDETGGIWDWKGGE